MGQALGARTLKFPPDNPSGPWGSKHLPWWVLPGLSVPMANSQGSGQCGRTGHQRQKAVSFSIVISLSHGPTNVRKMPTGTITQEMKIGARNGEMSNYFIFAS